MNDVKIEFATIRRKAEYKNCEEPKDQEIYKDIKAKEKKIIAPRKKPTIKIVETRV
jgi:hypothetical protein